LFPDATETTAVGGNKGDAVKTSGVKELNDACTACPLSTPPSVQFTWVWPLEFVAADEETDPPELPGVNTDPEMVPGENVTVWPLTGLLKVSDNITTRGEASCAFTAPDCPLPDTIANEAAVPATDVSVKVVDTGAPVVETCAVTVFTCALVPALNETHAVPVPSVVALLPTDEAPVTVGLTEKLTVVPTTLLPLFFTNAQS
jgi:hypothetical protein